MKNKEEIPVVTPLSSYGLGKKFIIFVPDGDWNKNDLLQNSQDGYLYKIMEISKSSGFKDGRLRLTTKRLEFKPAKS